MNELLAALVNYSCFSLDCPLDLFSSEPKLKDLLAQFVNNVYVGDP